jgi:8-oxo-dGTP pyrophosphatase MutT (NUDIX family)
VNPAAEVAVFVTRRHGREVLLLRRVPADGGYWHVVAGAIESGESAREAAVRELREETGLVAPLGEGVEVVEHATAGVLEPGTHATATAFAVAVSIMCYRVSAPDEWEPVLDREHDAHRWCPPREAADALVWRQTARALRALVPRA